MPARHQETEFQARTEHQVINTPGDPKHLKYVVLALEPADVPSEAACLAAELSVTSTVLAQSLGRDVNAWDAASRNERDARIDALIARSYGLSTHDYETVLDHFALMARIETKQLNEYRSKRLRLEAFEEIGGGR